MTKSRAFRIGKAFGKKGVLGKASLDTPKAVGATEIADSAEVLGTADASVRVRGATTTPLFVGAAMEQRQSTGSSASQANKPESITVGSRRRHRC